MLHRHSGRFRLLCNAGSPSTHQLWVTWEGPPRPKLTISPQSQVPDTRPHPLTRRTQLFRWYL